MASACRHIPTNLTDPRGWNRPFAIGGIYQCQYHIKGDGFYENLKDTDLLTLTND